VSAPHASSALGIHLPMRESWAASPSSHSAAVPIALGGAVADLNADGFDDLLLSVDGTSWELLLGSADGLAADPIAVPAP
jgi:hypothetical protein